MAQPQIVSIPNADDVYINGLNLVVANKVYNLPSVKIPDDFSLVVLAQTTNAGNIYISKTQPTNTNSIILAAGTSFRFRVKNANVLQVTGTVAGDNVILVCEINKGDD